jgi:NADH-quinone oxidoreductase subunit K
MELYIINFLIFSITLFFISILGIFLTRKNLILIIICIELMLLSINFNFIIFSVYLNDIFGQIITIFILTLAGAEASIGLAILIIFYRIRGIISINFLNILKG